MTPRVLHLNDCAGVARHLVVEAARQGHRWGYLPPSAVRPSRVPAHPLLARAAYAPFVARRALAVGRADVVHVHYGTSARLLRERGIPRRPYVLTLHGTDIREQWADPRYHAEIQRAVDGARHVYYANLDTAEQARAARPDAELMPFFVDPAELPAWTPAARPTVVFASRWEAVKGGRANVALAADLRRALPDADLVGLDWGPDAPDAARAGVRLLPRTSHPAFLRLLASAHVVVGQARPVVAVSETEALAIGVPLAALGSRLPREDGTTPPAIEGSRDDVVAGVREALADPPATAARLDGRRWALAHHLAAPWVPRLLRVYADSRGE